MDLIVYSNEGNKNGERIMEAVRRTGSELRTDLFRSIADLVRKVKRGKRDLSVVILCASTREELAAILAIRDLLRDLRMILILPDRESSTLAQGLTLRPRFFSFVDADFNDVSAVLARMLKVL